MRLFNNFCVTSKGMCTKINYQRHHMCGRSLIRELKKVELIEDNAIVNHKVLQESTTSPETLRVIESRQYRERGLLHISDSAYAFFMLLEQERVDRINSSKLAAFVHQKRKGTKTANESTSSLD